MDVNDIWRNEIVEVNNNNNNNNTTTIILIILFQ